ncbi:MAG: hypothetical protein M3452_06025 [Chloroflexota bacterium]|nr:hypothetical protein [Chloroflexota bacterium]
MTRHVPAAGVTQVIDVRGLLTVRLIDARDADVRAIEGQLGLPSRPIPDASLSQEVSLSQEASLSHEASLTVRYVDRLPERDGDLLQVGRPDMVWTEAGAAVVRSRGPDTRWALIPFEWIGGPLELVCERGIGRVPHLVALLNISLLARGVVPLHASAFVLEGVGSVAAGWSQSGKSEALLAAMAGGATFVSDEWTYLSSDGRARGLPTPIRLEPWHLRSGFVRQRATAAIGRGRLMSLRAADRLAGVPALSRAHLPGAGLIRRGRRLVGSDHVDVAARSLFGADSCADALPLERVYWLVPRAAGGRRAAAVHVESISSVETAARMALAHVHHRMEFLDAYWRFRYAFPHIRSELVDDMERRERELLETALVDLPIHRVEHPPGVDFGRLREAMRRAAG